ncbi:MAG: FAD-dependent tricarballylate dehydrogenase TcuA [Alphaproteobacteria bacterium]
MNPTRTDADVIVVGAGNAAFAAGVSASEHGAATLMLERAPEEEAGGNTRFTAGAIRFAYRGADDLRLLMPDLSAKEMGESDFGAYTEDSFFDDMGRLTEYRTDPDLCELLVKGSRPTVQWMRDKGIRFVPSWGRQAFRIDGRFTFWGGLAAEAWGGGPGLLGSWTEIARRQGIRVLHRCRAVSLLAGDGGVTGVRVRHDGRTMDMAARAVVLAAGGFESNAEWRARYLGPGWDLAKVRGTRFNTGDGIRMALDIGAMPHGNWSGCHAVGWDRNAPEFGDLSVGDGFQKHSYPLGIMLNARGERFVDEGADFRHYTYAKYGGVILEQPGRFAWQLFDSKVLPLLRDEYRIRRATKATAHALPELVGKLDGVDGRQALETIERFNAAVRADVPFNPNLKDGRSTVGLRVPKSNWANAIDRPPFEAYAVTCGITFTFGGLRITKDAQVLDVDLEPIPGLYAAGELVGGLFYGNYPGGTGLMAGAVFGRIAGRSAARAASVTSETAGGHV